MINSHDELGIEYFDINMIRTYMKHGFQCLFLTASLLQGAMLTSTTCEVGKDFGATTLFSAAQAGSCSHSPPSPSFPELYGYQVLAQAYLSGPGNAGVRTFTQSGPWDSSSPSEITTVRASANTLYEEDLLFSGMGLATLRLNVSASASPDISGGATFTINGVTQQFASTVNSFHTLDFTIPLGSAFAFSVNTTASSFTNNLNSTTDSGLIMSTQYFLYDANGRPFITDYVGTENGQYNLQLGADNGPVIPTSDSTTLPVETPEPSTVALLCIGIAAFGIRKVRLYLA
jgi:hypothetical protein